MNDRRDPLAKCSHFRGFIAFKEERVQVKIKLTCLLKGMFLHARKCFSFEHLPLLNSVISRYKIAYKGARAHRAVKLQVWTLESSEQQFLGTNRKAPHCMHNIPANDQYFTSFSWMFSEPRETTFQVHCQSPETQTQGMFQLLEANNNPSCVVSAFQESPQTPLRDHPALFFWIK